MTHLILHKVRGQPAFDIAEQIQIGDEEGWIIPTSGHRAYPYWTQPITQLVLFDCVPSMPDGWPDHYQAVDLPARKGMGRTDINIMALISNILPRINRRI